MTRRGTRVVHQARVQLWRTHGALLDLAAAATKRVTLTRSPRTVVLRIRGRQARLARGRYLVRISGRPDAQREPASTRARRRAS